jgi:hypothetical protein
VRRSSTVTDTDFRFRVSGVGPLGPAVMQRISTEFAAAVTRVLVADNPDLVDGKMFSLCRVNGGKNIMLRDADTLEGLVETAKSDLLDY